MPKREIFDRSDFPVIRAFRIRFRIRISDPDSNQGSGMEKVGSRIQDKLPGSATLCGTYHSVIRAFRIRLRIRIRDPGSGVFLNQFCEICGCLNILEIHYPPSGDLDLHKNIADPQPWNKLSKDCCLIFNCRCKCSWHTKYIHRSNHSFPPSLTHPPPPQTSLPQHWYQIVYILISGAAYQVGRNARTHAARTHAAAHTGAVVPTIP